MDWFRSYHGAPADTKLTLIARKSEQPRAIITAVWWELLDFASQNTPRGSITGIDYEIIAIQQDLDCNAVKRIVTTMQERGMIDENLYLSAWEKRQPKREDVTNNERVKRHREKKRNEAETKGDKELQPDLEDDETQCNADVTQDNAPEQTTEQTTEERREEFKSSLLPRANPNLKKGEVAAAFANTTLRYNDFDVSFDVVCLLLLKKNNKLSLRDQKILEILCERYDMRHVLTVIDNETLKFRERGDGDAPNSLRYFVDAIYQHCNQLRPVMLDELKNPGGIKAEDVDFEKYDEAFKKQRNAGRETRLPELKVAPG